GKRARTAQMIRPVNSKSGNPEEHEPLALIWAPTCVNKRQEVHFRRRVFVAGPLWKLGVYVGGAQPHPAFFERFDVLINGRRVLRTNGGGGGFERSADRAGPVQWGENLFEVVAVRKPFANGY